MGWPPVVCVSRLAEKRREDSEGEDTLGRRLAERNQKERRREREEGKEYKKKLGFLFNFRIGLRISGLHPNPTHY